MSDLKSQVLAQGRTIAKLTLATPNFSAGLPNGVRVATNAGVVARFPLPLTIGSAVLGAIGVLATIKGHKIIGYGLVGLGIAGIGAAAAAPELTDALNRAGTL